MTDTIGSRLSALRQRSGLSLAAVAKEAGFAGPSSVQTYFRDDYNTPLRAALATKFASAMVGRGTPPIGVKEFFSLSDIGELLATSQHSGQDQGMEEWSDVYEVFRPALKRSREMKRSEGLTKLDAVNAQLDRAESSVPVYSSDLLPGLPVSLSDDTEGDAEMFWVRRKPVSYAPYPPAIQNNRDLYMIFVSGSAMAPRFRYGEPMFVDPTRPPAIGEDVLVRVGPGDETPEGFRLDEEGPTVLGTLIRRTSLGVEIEQYQPARKFTISSEMIVAVHRVVPWRECFAQ